MTATVSSAADVFRRLPWKVELNDHERAFLHLFMFLALELLDKKYDHEPTLESIRAEFNSNATWWLKRAIGDCPTVYNGIAGDHDLAEAWFEGIWALVEPDISAAVKNGEFKKLDEKCGGLEGGCGTLMERWQRTRNAVN